MPSAHPHPWACQALPLLAMMPFHPLGTCRPPGPNSGHCPVSLVSPGSQGFGSREEGAPRGKGSAMWGGKEGGRPQEGEGEGRRAGVTAKAGEGSKSKKRKTLSSFLLKLSFVVPVSPVMCGLCFIRLTLSDSFRFTA